MLESSSDAKILRSTCSAILTGVINGYGESRFGSHRGWFLLPDNARIWVGSLGLVTNQDAALLHQRFDPSDRGLYTGFAHTGLPTLAAIAQMLQIGGLEPFALPVVSEYVPRPARVEISLQLFNSTAVKRFIDIHCYTDGIPLELPILRDALVREVSLI